MTGDDEKKVFQLWRNIRSGAAGVHDQSANGVVLGRIIDRKPFFLSRDVLAHDRAADCERPAAPSGHAAA